MLPTATPLPINDACNIFFCWRLVLRLLLRPMRSSQTFSERIKIPMEVDVQRTFLFIYFPFYKRVYSTRNELCYYENILLLLLLLSRLARRQDLGRDHTNALKPKQKPHK